jgi:hypothetical protein
MATQTLGIIDITWRGTKLDIEPGAKIRLGGLKNSAVVTTSRTHFARRFETSEVTATLPLKRGMSLTALLSVAPGELQVSCDSGQVFTGSAFLIDAPEATGGEGGKIELKWNGDLQEVA